MEIFLAILAVLFLVVGIVGCVIPALPGPPISYIGLLLLQWSGYGGFTTRFLIVWAVITVIVTLLDYYFPVWMTKMRGGSRAATIGSALGLIAGIFWFPPLGMIVLPFIGAFVGELVFNRADSTAALKVAMASFVAFLLGTGIKLIVCAIMFFYGIRAFFV